MITPEQVRSRIRAAELVPHHIPNIDKALLAHAGEGFPNGRYVYRMPAPNQYEIAQAIAARYAELGWNVALSISKNEIAEIGFILPPIDSPPASARQEGGRT